MKVKFKDSSKVKFKDCFKVKFKDSFKVKGERTTADMDFVW